VLEDLDLALELVNSDELDNLNEALEIAALAFEEAYLNGVYEQEYNESNQLFEYEYYDFVIPVTVISTNGEHEYSINSEVNSIDFELKATFSSKSDTKSEYGELCEFNEDLYDDNELHTENSNGFFDIEGNLRSRNLEMNNIKGNVSARYNCSYIASLLNSEEIYTWDDYSTGSINLEVEINQTTSNPLTFKGIFELNTELSRSHKNSHHYDNEYYADYDHGDDHDHYDDHGDDHDEYYYPEYAHSDDQHDDYGEYYYPEDAHSDFHYDDYDDDRYYEYGEGYYPEYEDSGLEAYEVNSSYLLSGEFKKGDKKIAVTITASANDKGGELWANGVDLRSAGNSSTEINTTSEDFDFFNLLDTIPVVEFETDSANESNVYVGISLDFTTTASSDITGIDLVTSNDHSNSRKWSLNVALGKKRLSFDYSPALEDYPLTVTNQNGTTLKLSEQCFEEEDCENIGFITVDNEEMGTISYDASNKVAVVTYKNGSSEPIAF
jgi:hypothetical protein